MVYREAQQKNRLFRCVRCFAPLWRRAIEFLFPQYFFYIPPRIHQIGNRAVGRLGLFFIGAMNLRSNPPLLDS